MSVHRIMHASAIAATVFSDATDAFVARLPNHKKLKTKSYGGTPRTQTDKTHAPVSGCYLCAASDHYASDTRFHPLLPDGSHEKLSAKTKQAIMDRIDNSDLSASLKAAERDKVKSYWSQHSL